MKRFSTLMLGACAAMFAAQAEVPEGYYLSLDGKQGAELRTAICQLSEGHTRVTYNTKTWPAFEATDVRDLQGCQIWWDMYSNNIVYLPGHDALNIEHAVANSWWGGKNGSLDAYSDLFHLSPSDQQANNTKNNHPIGETSDARLMDNGLSRIGTPVEGQGGGSPTVFEPADEYKGDFARAIMYVFSAYPDIPWITDESHAYMYDADKQLQPWAVEMLLRWNAADPVDTKEMNRNEAIYALQNNRNPFIDHPELAEYVWGSKNSEPYVLGDAVVATDRPLAPVFDDMRLTAVNTYSHRWWDGFPLNISHEDGTLMLSIDGRDYFESSGTTYIIPAENMEETHRYSAYAVTEVDGCELRSPIARLSLTPLDPMETNYSKARWTRVEQSDDIEDGVCCLILSANTLHSMSTAGGTTQTKFMESAGFVEFDDEGQVVEIPADAAVVKLWEVGDGKHSLAVYDTRGRFKGYWNASGKNTMSLSEAEYTPATASTNDAGQFKLQFDQYGSLQFNKTQPRFLNYESSQTPVYLYKFLDFGLSSVINTSFGEKPWSVGVDSEGIIVDDNTTVYDLGGRRIEGRRLDKGLYIVVGPDGNSHKVMF